MVLTFRDDELRADHPLRRVLGGLPPTAVRRLHVPPLSRDAVATLAGARADDLYAVTGGNAFFVTEALASGSDEPPPSVRDAVLARAGRLAPASRSALDLVAVVPGGAELWLVREAQEDVAAPLGECEERGLLHVDGDVVRFRHELARRVIEDALPGGRRAELHARVLDALARWNIDPARLVHHAVEAGDRARAVDLSLRAARAATESRAHAEAAAHLQRALAHGELLDQAERAATLEALASASYHAGRVEGALEACIAAVGLRREAGDALRLGDDLRLLARLHWWGTADSGEAQRALQEAIAVLEPLGATPELAMAYSGRAQLLMLEQRDAEAIAAGERALDLARELDDAAVYVHALTTVGSTRLRDPDEMQGRAEVEEAIALAARTGNDEQECRAAVALAWMAVDFHAVERARPACDRVLALADAREQRTFALYGLACRARLDVIVGDWDAATAAAEEVLAQPDLPSVARMPASAVLATVDMRRGGSRAQALLEEAAALAYASGELQRIGAVACAQAELAWLRDDLAEAERASREPYALALRVGHAWDLGDLAEWRWRAGALDGPPAGCAEPQRLLLSGQPADAADAWLAIGDRYRAALALTEDPDPDRQLQAVALLDELGAEATARRVRRGLRARGIVNVPRGPRPSTRANPSGLTARQLEVLGLLATGATNVEIARQLFLTPKTVEHHVGAVLAKLGVAGRAQAAERAQALGLVEPGVTSHPTWGHAPDGTAARHP